MMELRDLPKDPARVAALKQYNQIEGETFTDAEDQTVAQLAFGNQVTAKGKKEGDTIDLHPGDIIDHGGKFQEVKEPFQIKLASRTHDFASSEQLPDGSVVHVSTGLLKR